MHVEYCVEQTTAVLLLVMVAVESRTCQENDETADVSVLKKAGLVCAENGVSVGGQM